MELYVELTACCEAGDCKPLEDFILGLGEDFFVESRENQPGVLDLEAVASPVLEENGTFERMADVVRLLYVHLSDTSEAPVRTLAFRNGSKRRPSAVLSAMEKDCDLGSRGIAARTLGERKQIDKDATAALRKAIRDNWKIDRVEPLLERGADVNGKADGMSFLEYALDNRNGKVALALLQRGADADKADKALRWAVEAQVPAVIRAILETGEVTPGAAVLHEAILSNKPATVSLLLRHGADPAARYRGATAFSAIFKYFDYCDDRRIENKKKILALLLKDERQRADFQKNIGRYISQIRRNADRYQMPCAQKLIGHLEDMRAEQ